MPARPATMRALVFDAPASDTHATRVANIAVPEPGPGQISIDVQHAGVNFVDVMARRGDQGYGGTWPFVPGFEVAGTVRAVGPDGCGLAVGDRVAALTGAGGLAEVAIAPAALSLRVPEGVDLEPAAAAPGALTTASLLLAYAGRLCPGEVVLVHSAGGGVGQAVARLARLSGAMAVLGTVGRPDGVGPAEQAGYDTVLVRGPELTGAIREATGGRGVDVVLDPQGTALVSLDLEVTAPGGRIVLFGNASGEPMGPLPPAGRLFAGNVSIGGFSLSQLAATAPERVAEALRGVLDHLGAGRLDIELTTVDGLENAAEAQQALAERRGRGKQVVRMAVADPS